MSAQGGQRPSALVDPVELGDARRTLHETARSASPELPALKATCGHEAAVRAWRGQSEQLDRQLSSVSQPRAPRALHFALFECIDACGAPRAHPQMERDRPERTKTLALKTIY
ncbi:hypothetical protein [Streptomyces venezuelae]